MLYFNSDFSKIFNNFADLLAANPTVFATVISILACYSLLAVWARRRDRKDVEVVRFHVLGLLLQNNRTIA